MKEIAPSSAGLPGSLRVLVDVARRLERGKLSITVPDGRIFRAAGAEPGPDAALIVHRPRAVRRLLLGGTIGFAESYMEGDWETPDLTALLELACANDASLTHVTSGGRMLAFVRRIWHVWHANTRSGSKRNIAYHYDLGNQFYERWLDPTMTYSSAVFSEPTQELAAAQRNKYRAIAEKLDLKPHHTVLEIGCGWGGFASFIAREYGCKVTAITVSKEQLAYTQARIQREGLGTQVEARFLDYRDLDGRFDRIASIEMFEAVGEKYWAAFFSKVRDCLEPGGLAALQVITIADHWYDSYRKGVDFIQRYIFPGGMLPSVSALRGEIGRAGLELARQDFFGTDYARTLAEWRQRFLAAWPEIAPMGFDARFRRMWEFYLAYCEAGFRAQTIDVTQVALIRR
jgi:cyclopropane-fatty-acyl-phospholipid synthase